MPWANKSHKPGKPGKTHRRDQGSRNALYDRRWRNAREAYLKMYPWCVHCQRDGNYVLADVVDHIIPHKNDRALFWDQSNWQGLCTTHHNIKTATEDGGFGNESKH